MSASARRGAGTGEVTRGGWSPSGISAHRRANVDLVPDSKATRTRQRLLDAARVVFARQGYVHATVGDIVTEAGLARGSFYTYFESKQHMFRHLAGEIERMVINDVLRFDGRRTADAVANLTASNRNYLALVRDNADLYALVDQVAALDEGVRRARSESQRRHVVRVADTIRRWQRRGWASPDIDPMTMSAAMVAMVSGFATSSAAAGAEPSGRRLDDRALDEAAAALTDIWVNACGVERSDSRVRPQRSPS